MTERLLSRFLPSVTGTFAAFLALVTMSHSIGYVDSGELAAAATILGVPHPTGYPLKMIVGHAATVLNPGSPLTGLLLLNVLFFGLSASVLSLAFKRMLCRENVSGWALHISSAAGSLLVVLSSIWWQQTSYYEVYALHGLLMAALLFSLLICIDEEKKLATSRSLVVTRSGFLFSFVLGLAFSNHLSTIVLAPAFIYLFVKEHPHRLGGLKRVAAFVPGLLLGLLPYVYLPIRAAANPPLNWGRPDTWGRFIDHVTGEQYSGLMFDWSVLDDQLGWFLSTLPEQFAYIGFILIVVGMVVAWMRHRRVATFGTLLVLSTMLYAGTYAIKEIEPYFMAATLGFGVFGLVAIREGLARFGGRPFALVVTLVVAALAVNGFVTLDRSDDTVAESLTRTVLSELPRDALLFTTKWDVIVSPSLYLQYAEDVRPDITVVNPGMFHDRTYLSSLLEQNPSLKRASNRIRRFVNMRKMADHGGEESVDATEYRRRFLSMVNGMISSGGRPVYVTAEVDTLIGRGYNRIPLGLTSRLSRDTVYVPAPPPDYDLEYPDQGVSVDLYNAALIGAEALVKRSQYESSHGYPGRAQERHEAAARFDPGLTENDVSDLPMGNEEYIVRCIRYFERLKSTLQTDD